VDKILQKLLSWGNFWSTVLLTLLPIHWLLVLILVASFSMTWALAMGVFMFTYPHLMWQQKYEQAPIRKWDALSRIPLAKSFFQYFPINLTRTTKLSPNKRYIFGYHPHGSNYDKIIF
jgi:2-acylglycerol O-acyltransferase 2